jgi:two-component system cell cycle response regulator
MNKDLLKILLVEDDSEDVVLVRTLLKKNELNADIRSAESLKEGLDALSEDVFDVALVDLGLPDSTDSFAFTHLVEKYPELPIVVLTGANDGELALVAIQKGAQDYLVKGEIPGNLLIRSIQHAIERKRNEIKLTQMVETLSDANRKILDQQKSVIEEERLKVLMQMAGATAHELNQPLMSLLGNIQLFELSGNNPETQVKYVRRIKDFGEKIAEVVRKIQNIHNDDVKAYPGSQLGIINFDQRLTILYVEDDDTFYDIIETLMETRNTLRLKRTASLKDAFQILATEPIDLVLLDHVLPDGTSIDFIRTLNHDGIDIPVVVITGQGDEMVASQVIQAGASDYLTKTDLGIKQLFRAIDNSIEKFRLKKEKQKVLERLAQMSTRDELTGLYNRRFFLETLQREVSSADRYKTNLALCMMDMDRFQRINDTYGHIAGDRVLSEIAKVIRETLRSSDIACRYSGEEFAVILPDTNEVESLQVAERIRELIENHTFRYDSMALDPVTVSIGLVVHDPVKIISPDEFISRADQALGWVKNQGGNRVVVFR